MRRSDRIADFQLPISDFRFAIADLGWEAEMNKEELKERTFSFALRVIKLAVRGRSPSQTSARDSGRGQGARSQANRWIRRDLATRRSARRPARSPNGLLPRAASGRAAQQRGGPRDRWATRARGHVRRGELPVRLQGAIHRRVHRQARNGQGRADESAFWMELSIAAGLLREKLVAPLLGEANELVRIMAASRKTASRRHKR